MSITITKDEYRKAVKETADRILRTGANHEEFTDRAIFFGVMFSCDLCETLFGDDD